MSWDIVLFNSSQKISTVEDIDENQLVPCDFGAAFNAGFKNIKQDGEHYSIEGENFSIEYFDDGEPTSNALLNLHGEAALYPIIDLAIKNNWQIFDTGLGEMIDLHKPAKNGYQKFRDYLNYILKK